MTSRTLLRAALNELDQGHPPDAPVPHLIHMTARNKELEGDFAANLQRIRDMNPGWTVTVYDDTDIERFIQESYGAATLALYGMLNKRYGAARADLFRYLCVYRLGGVYLDLKSTTTRPLDDWIRPSDRYLLSQWDNAPTGQHSDWGLYPELAHIPHGEYQQWFIVAAAGHPFLRAVIAEVLRTIACHRPLPVRCGRQGVIRVTGPVRYTLAIHPIREQHPHRLIDVEDAMQGGLVYSIFEGEREHYKLNAVHYSQLTEPIVALSPMGTRVFNVARDVRLLLSGRKHRVVSALAGVKRRVKRRLKRR
ncbi:MAG: hypothetical protein I8H76_02355 [Burkholderiales bacterium]|nr:hypothetical protein [Burkholderiales bacterium]MBH2015292.1 hypothetical protein [Burkholderiales bacterium]